MATSNNDTSIYGDRFQLTAPKDRKKAKDLSEALSALEKLGLFENKRLCLHLIAHLAERIGYECAGHTGTLTVAELMLMSASASELAERLDKVDAV